MFCSYIFAKVTDCNIEGWAKINFLTLSHITYDFSSEKQEESLSSYLARVFCSLKEAVSDQ